MPFLDLVLAFAAVAVVSWLIRAHVPMPENLRPIASLWILTARKSVGLCSLWGCRPRGIYGEYPVPHKVRFCGRWAGLRGLRTDKEILPVISVGIQSL
jgi:hypothetical protein